MSAVLSTPARTASRLRTIAVFVAAAGMSALAVGIPSDVIDTPLFTRMTPVRAWEVPVLLLTALLTGAWSALSTPGPAACARGGGRVLGSTLLSAVAVGCPVCNKLIVAALGVSGALGTWAPLQPFVALLALGIAATAVVARWRSRRSPCTTAAVPVTEAVR